MVTYTNNFEVSQVHYFYLTLQIAAKAETEDNEQEQKRQQGKKLLYGQIIQVTLNDCCSKAPIFFWRKKHYPHCSH